MTLLRELNSFYLFSIYLLQELYMQFLGLFENNLDMDVFNYELKEVQHNLMIHHRRKNQVNKKVVMILVGGFQLENSPVAKKVFRDFETIYPTTFGERHVLYPVKMDKCSLAMYDDLSLLIRKLYADKGGLEELTIIGFSSGAVVGSHVLQKVRDLNIKSKIISYDTPLHVQANVEYWPKEKFNYYRPDFLMYHIVYDVYKRHYNTNELTEHLTKPRNSKNAYAFVDLVKSVHNFSDVEMEKQCSFNLEQNQDFVLICIYGLFDPIHNIETTFAFLKENEERMKMMNYISIPQRRIGHCTSMAFSSAYIHDILHALEQ